MIAARKLGLVLLALVVAGVGLLGACSKTPATTTTQSPAPKPSTPSPTSTDVTLPSKIFQIGETSQTAQVEVIAGDRFALALPANQTTGFQWSASSVPAFLTSEGSKYTTTATPAMPGSGGTQYLIFKATEAGSGAVSLVYQRPNSTEAPGRTVTVNVFAAGPG